MRATVKVTAAAIGFCSLAIGAAPAMAQGYYYGGGVAPLPPAPYYGQWLGPRGSSCTYLGCCPKGWTVQGGVCKPYQGPRGPYWGNYRRW
jgi:hypothetical protein